MAALSKSEIRSLSAKARECRLFAGEAVAKAAYAAEENDVASFQGYMAEAGRLAILAGKLQRQAAEARETLAVAA